MSTTLFSLQAGNYSNTVVSTPAVVPNDVSTINIQIESSKWTDTTSSATITLELSKDNGATWQSWTSAIIKGGAVDRKKQPVTTQSITASSKQVSGLQVKMTMVITGILITDSITIIGS